MMFEIEKTKGITVLTATKRIEGKSRVTAREQIDELLENGDTRLILDLSLVDRIDSSGLASVVSAFRRARTLSGDLYICGLNQRLIDIFNLTLLSEVIPIFESRDAAAAAFQDLR